MSSCAVLLSFWPIKNLNSYDFWWLDLWKPSTPPLATVFCINTEILENATLQKS